MRMNDWMNKIHMHIYLFKSRGGDYTEVRRWTKTSISEHLLTQQFIGHKYGETIIIYQPHVTNEIKKRLRHAK